MLGHGCPILNCWDSHTAVWCPWCSGADPGCWLACQAVHASIAVQVYWNDDECVGAGKWWLGTIIQVQLHCT